MEEECYEIAACIFALKMKMECISGMVIERPHNPIVIWNWLFMKPYIFKGNFLKKKTLQNRKKVV